MPPGNLKISLLITDQKIVNIRVQMAREIIVKSFRPLTLIVHLLPLKF